MKVRHIRVRHPVMAHNEPPVQAFKEGHHEGGRVLVTTAAGDELSIPAEWCTWQQPPTVRGKK